MDSPDVWHITHLELTVRMMIAAFLGGIIGLEREWSNHAAGFRTHILVCIGSAIIMLLSIYGFSDFVYEYNVRTDPARLAAQVISGIGFLGAGAILRTGATVSGLTTAASIWVVAAIGLAAGAGFYYGAALATGIVLVSLFLLNKWEKRLLRHRRSCELEIQLTERPGILSEIMTTMEEAGAALRHLTVSQEPSDGIQGMIRLKVSLRTKSPQTVLEAMQKISVWPEVIRIESGQLTGSRFNASAERVSTLIP